MGIDASQAALLVAQGGAAAPGIGSPFILITASVAWATLWIQFIVLPFFNKGETLHKDYWASGRINSVMAGIEAQRLIPALCRMFVRAIEAQTDKRKRPEHEIEALLQSVEFLPDLKDAQNAMSEMERLQHCYSRLKISSSRLWKWGALHVLVTPTIPSMFSWMTLDIWWKQTVFCSAIAWWFVTLGFSAVGAVRFHSQLSTFTSSLELAEEGAQ